MDQGRTATPRIGYIPQRVVHGARVLPRHGRAGPCSDSYWARVGHARARSLKRRRDRAAASCAASPDRPPAATDPVASPRLLPVSWSRQADEGQAATPRTTPRRRAQAAEIGDTDRGRRTDCGPSTQASPSLPDSPSPQRRNPTRNVVNEEEEVGFWTWAIVETLRHSGDQDAKSCSR